MLLRQAAPLGGASRPARDTAGRLPEATKQYNAISQRQTSRENKYEKTDTTFNSGSLGSGIDEERSEMRYVM